MPQAAALSAQPLAVFALHLRSRVSLDWALAVICAIAFFTAPIAAKAQSLTTIYNFAGEADGSTPYAPLVRDAEGNLFGTTGHGGTANAGTVFEINNQGVETILHSFGGPPDGGGPFAGLVRDKEGSFYGTTSYGGTHNLGTVFKITKDGEERILHSFNGADGNGPVAGLILDSQGNLHGTTAYGGTGSCPSVGKKGCGTVFVLSPNGAERVIFSFKGGTNGEFPNSALVRDAVGNLYGTTSDGGCTNMSCGTAFRISPAGVWKLLHRFGASDDGNIPNGVVFGPAGNLYGTTISGGTHSLGTVFVLTTTGREKVLYNFGGYSDDGTFPGAGLLWDGAASFYGTTEQGGTPGCLNGCGTIFQVTTTGVETVEYSFGSNGTGGFIPFAGLIRDSAGNLYGTTGEGGTTDNGTVFKFTP